MGRGGGRLGRGGAQQASWGQGRTVDTHRSPEGHVCSRPHAQGPKWAGERLCPLADPTGALFLGGASEQATDHFPDHGPPEPEQS